MRDSPLDGPLLGQPIPLHGGAPTAGGCNGCTDCCHLPEISVTDEEADRLWEVHATFESPLGELVIDPDPSHEGWRIMRGPCVFRRLDQPLAAGGCRIYADRPASCDIFTCELRLAFRRTPGSSLDPAAGRFHQEPCPPLSAHPSSSVIVAADFAPAPIDDVD